MAGRGRAPKFADRRAGHTLPLRGEWQFLPPLTKPVLPALPRRARGEGAWSERTKAMWAAWRADWVTGAYDGSDIAMAVQLAYLFEDSVRNPLPNRVGEVRRWMDALGLTQKGKRDLRLQLAAEWSTDESAPTGSNVRLVGDRLVDYDEFRRERRRRMRAHEWADE